MLFYRKKTFCLNFLKLRHPHLTTKERCVPITYRLHKRAKFLRLRLSKDYTQATITIPATITLEEVSKFFERCDTWIKDQPLRVTERVLFDHGVPIPFLGKTVTVQFSDNLEDKIKLEKDKLLVKTSLKCKSAVVKGFLKESLYKYMLEKSQKYAGELDVKIQSIALKEYSARWGSCSSKGDLTYCWRLVFSPLMVIDYLCAHEVAHLKEMNHSSVFWSYVSQLTPHYGEAKAWLKTQGSSLFLYGEK